MAIASAGGAAGNTGAGGCLSEARAFLGVAAVAAGATGTGVVAGRDWASAAAGAGRIASVGAVVVEDGGVPGPGIDTTGTGAGAWATATGCAIGPGVTTRAGSTTGEGARADAIGGAGGVGVPAPSNAGFTRKGGSGSAAADPAASSSIGNMAGLNCPRREDDMPNRCVGATLDASRRQRNACDLPEWFVPADARIGDSITSIPAERAP